MLKNDYLVVKIGPDTAENEPFEGSGKRAGAAAPLGKLSFVLGLAVPRARKLRARGEAGGDRAHARGLRRRTRLR